MATKKRNKVQKFKTVEADRIPTLFDAACAATPELMLCNAIMDYTLWAQTFAVKVDQLINIVALCATSEDIEEDTREWYGKIGTYLEECVLANVKESIRHTNGASDRMLSVVKARKPGRTMVADDQATKSADERDKAAG